MRTHNPSKRAAVDSRLRPRGHWDRHVVSTVLINYSVYVCNTNCCTPQIARMPTESWREQIAMRTKNTDF
jgi:hypothetical protein